jgi:NAD(P)-dependent dehydrogenase (short-subunit alcohol dehydrogenase family)
LLRLAQTNYLSHFLLTQRLLPLLLSTAQVSKPGAVRVVDVTSGGHQTFMGDMGISFDDIDLESAPAMKRYGHSKLANILHAKELNKRFGPTSPGKEGKIWTAAVHPGNIATDLNVQATGVAPASVLRVGKAILRCVGVLAEQEKGGWSSSWAIASEEFKESYSGAYVVPYMKIGTPSAAARNESLASKLWDWTEDQLRQKGFDGAAL